MPGGKIVTVEQVGKLMLCCYGSPAYPGWAVFRWSERKQEWNAVENGKFEDVLKKYVDALKTQC